MLVGVDLVVAVCLHLPPSRLQVDAASLERRPGGAASASQEPEQQMPWFHRFVARLGGFLPRMLDHVTRLPGDHESLPLFAAGLAGTRRSMLLVGRLLGHPEGLGDPPPRPALRHGVAHLRRLECLDLPPQLGHRCQSIARVG